MSIKKIIFLGFIACLTFTSCRKDDNKDNSPFNKPYADFTDEENKANLEDAGIAMLDEIETMMDANAIAVSLHFAELSQEMDKLATSSSLFTSINTLASLAKTRNPQEAIVDLKSVAEAPDSFSDFWDENVGTYVWNADSYEWIFTKGTDEIVIQFPGLEGDMTNTAVYTVSNFTYVDIIDPAYDIETEEFDIQLPTTLNASLTYNGSELASYSLSANYQDDGTPILFDSKLSIDDFDFIAKITHNVNKAATMTFALKHLNETLIELYADATGNWSEDNIEDNIEEFDTTYYEDGATYSISSSTIYVENIVKNSNAHFQLMNIKVAGRINFTDLAPKTRELSEKYFGKNYSKIHEDIDEEAYFKELTDLYNQYIDLVVVYANDNKKIAVAEVYAYEKSYDFGSYWTMDVRFVFSDGSKTDAETYFGEGFDTLLDELDNFLADIEDEYGS